MLKFGQGHASPQEASHFMAEFKAMNTMLTAQKKLPISPEEFTQLSQQMARSSFAYHGRPPSMYEIARLRDAHPKDVADYYGSLPDEHYPTVSAADMAKALASARPWANQIVGRDATKLEAAYLHHSGQNPQSYFQQVSSGTDDTRGAQPGVSGSGNDGGQPTTSRAVDPGVASGAPAAGGAQGIPAR